MHRSELAGKTLAQSQKEGVTAHVVIPEAERQWENAPQNLKARMLDPTTVRLTWNPPQERAGEVTNYRIYRKPVSDTRRIGDSYRDHILVAHTSGASTSHIDHSAQAGVAYEYTVKAYRNGHSGPWGATRHWYTPHRGNNHATSRGPSRGGPLPAGRRAAFIQCK